MVFARVPICLDKGRLAVIAVVFCHAAADEEVRGDVVSFGEGVPVAEFSFGCPRPLATSAVKIEFVDVVLDGVFGVSELLVQCDAFRAVSVRVVFAVAYEVYVGELSDEGGEPEYVVDEVSVILLLEVFDASGVTYEAVDHRFKYDFEVPDQKVFLVSVPVFICGVVGEE